MSVLVIDASIAVKWVVEEDGTPEALAIRQKARLIAPDLLIAECANILWKKVKRRELVKQEALIAARLLQGADLDTCPCGLYARLQREYRLKVITPLTTACIWRSLSKNNAVS